MQAAVALCILIWLQLTGVIFIAYINGHMGGLWSPPCVCEANVLSPGHRVTFIVMKSGNLVLDLMHVFKDVFVCVLSAGNFVLSVPEAVWQRPVQTSCLGMVWVAVRDLI